MKVLLLSTISPDREGRIKRLISRIVENHEVHVFSPKTINKEKNVTYYDLSNQTPIGYISQIKYYFSLKKSLNLYKNRTYDVVYLCNYTSLPFFKRIRRFNKNITIIYDAFELLIKTKNERSTFRDVFYKKLEHSICKKADYIISANYERSLIMQGYYRLTKTPYTIFNIPLFEIEKSKKKNELIYFDKIRAKIVYIGVISKNRKIQELINVIIKYNSKLEFHIYGDGEYLNELKRIKESTKQDNIYFYGKYFQKDIKNILKNYDIGYINYPNTGLNNIFCEPNKIYDYALYDLPLVSFYHNKLDDIFTKYRIGESNNNIENGLYKILDNYAEYKENIKKYKKYIYKKSLESTSITKTIFSEIEKKQLWKVLFNLNVININNYIS